MEEKIEDLADVVDELGRIKSKLRLLGGTAEMAGRTETPLSQEECFGIMYILDDIDNRIELMETVFKKERVGEGDLKVATK